MIPQIIKNFLDSDIGYSFIKSKVAIVSSVMFLTIVLISLFAVLVAPYNPFDPKNISLMDAFTPPIWSVDGSIDFLLGTSMLMSFLHNWLSIACFTIGVMYDCLDNSPLILLPAKIAHLAISTPTILDIL